MNVNLNPSAEQKTTRRNFLKTAALAGAAMGLPGCVTTTAPTSVATSAQRIVGANGDIRVAVIGFRSRGAAHIGALSRIKGVRIVALCDVDHSVLDKKVAELSKKGVTVEAFTDIRKLLEKKDLDAVSIATPNHWHSLAGIWAMQAGMDVYTEKPVSHNVWEGRQLAGAAKKFGKIVQTGTQCRSSVGIAEGVKYVQSGALGKILVSRGFCYKPRKSIGQCGGPQKVPETIDYDIWCGPAPTDPPHRNGPNGPVHYDWHWFWNFGGGDLGNQGIHQMDICRWFLGEPELAPAIVSAGGRFGYSDDAETPNTFVTLQNYAKAPLIFEVRGLPKAKQYQDKTWENNMDKYKSARVGCVIECEGGYVVVPSYSQAIVYDKDGKEMKKFSDKGASEAGQPDLSGGSESGHHANWIAAVRARNEKLLTAPILGGHISSALCHTANISYKLGAKKAPGEIREQLKGQRGIGEAFDRMAAHLEANGVDINSDKVALGVPLQLDPKTEKFIGNADADKLLTRNYRAPFVVPQIA